MQKAEETQQWNPEDDNWVKVTSLTSKVGLEAAVGGLRSLVLISSTHGPHHTLLPQVITEEEQRKGSLAAVEQYRLNSSLWGVEMKQKI